MKIPKEILNKCPKNDKKGLTAGYNFIADIILKQQRLDEFKAQKIDNLDTVKCAKFLTYLHLFEQNIEKQYLVLNKLLELDPLLRTFYVSIVEQKTLSETQKIDKKQ